jgi:hypothetical protein
VPCRSGSSRSGPSRWATCQSAFCRAAPPDRRAVGAEGRRRQRQSPGQILRLLRPLKSRFSSRSFPNVRRNQAVTRQAFPLRIRRQCGSPDTFEESPCSAADMTHWNSTPSGE